MTDTAYRPPTAAGTLDQFAFWPPTMYNISGFLLMLLFLQGG